MADIKRASMQLVGTRISKLTIKNDFISLPDNCKHTLDLDYKIGKIQSIDESITKELGENFKDALITNGIMTLTVQNSHDENSMDIEIEADACFIYFGSDKEDFEQLARKNGAATLYSVLRGQLMSITSQCVDGKSIVLPMLNFSEISGLANKKI